MRIFHLNEPVEHSIKGFLCIVCRVLYSSKTVPCVGWVGPRYPLILQVPDKMVMMVMRTITMMTMMKVIEEKPNRQNSNRQNPKIFVEVGGWYLFIQKQLLLIFIFSKCPKIRIHLKTNSLEKSNKRKQRDYASSFKYVLERSQTNANNVTLKTPFQGI